MKNVGLDYITLERKAATLSGGESQRIRLATQIGSSLIGVLYILDEPSIGLHQRDNQRLIDTLLYLRNLGNTLIVVEHDEQTLRVADYIVDLGPGAGVHGGAVVAAGTPDEVMQVKAPSGMETETFFKLCSVTPCKVKKVPFPFRRSTGSSIRSVPARY